jgi:hypothetical protein
VSKLVIVVALSMMCCAVFLAACGRYDFTEKKHTMLKGKVLDTDGKAVQDAGVIVRTQAAGGSPRVWESATDKNGDYKVEVEWYRFANYYLLITHPEREGQPNAATDYDLQIDSWGYISEMTVDEIHISLAPAGDNSISGTVMLQSGGGASYTPLSNVVVTIDATHHATTDISGAFIINGLIDGSYTLTPVLEGYTFEPANVNKTVPPDTIVAFIAHPAAAGT